VAGGLVARRRLGFWQWFAVVVVKPLMIMLTRRTWLGTEYIPKSGPVIIVANHISHADPFALAHYVYDAGRWPRYLAKASIFRIPVLGRIVFGAKQIPVLRGTVDAARALDDAIAAIKDEHALLIYPEGTTSKEPDLWPMRGKTGAARLWLITGAPVVPIVMWGPQELFDPRTRKLHPRRVPVTIQAGPPLDLSEWAGAAPTMATLQEITDFIMLSLRDMLAEIRGGTPPPLWARPARRSTSEE
jgi:1-acyl-sn-glycerol-3-phosphate acyltransferase